MSEKIELRDEAKKKQSDYHQRGEVGNERADRRQDGEEPAKTRVNQAKSEIGTSESRSHKPPDDRPGNNDNLGSGRARSHDNAPGRPKTRARKDARQ
jgi:hypothetical protein